MAVDAMGWAGKREIECRLTYWLIILIADDLFYSLCQTCHDTYDCRTAQVILIELSTSHASQC